MLSNKEHSMKDIELNWKSQMESIFSEHFICAHRLHPQDFTRNRKLSFANVMAFILKTAKKSLQIECNFFAELMNEESITKQAMSKARAKIGVSAFQQLHRDLIKNHYEDNPYDLWNGYRIFGGDGSTLQLPDEGDIPEFFGKFFKHVTLARIFQYVELTTDTIVAPCIMPYSLSEDRMAKGILPDLVERMRSYGQSLQLYVYDRGYPSHKFALQHLELGVDFLFRVPMRFSPIIDKIVEKGEEADFIMEINRSDAKYSARVIVTYLPSGQPLLLFTSLKDVQLFNTESIVNAYQLRWRSEESYKFQKFLLQMENYTGRSVHTALQDYWAGVFIAAAMNMFFQKKEKEIHKEVPEKTRVNKSVVFAAMRDDFLEALLTHDTSDKIFKKFDKLCRRFRVPIRPNRSYPRLPNETRRGRHIYRKCL